MFVATFSDDVNEVVGKNKGNSFPLNTKLALEVAKKVTKVDVKKLQNFLFQIRTDINLTDISRLCQHNVIWVTVAYTKHICGHTISWTWVSKILYCLLQTNRITQQIHIQWHTLEFTSDYQYCALSEIDTMWSCRKLLWHRLLSPSVS